MYQQKSKGSSSSLNANSRSKRSHTNLSNLRLAPLSSQYVAPSKDVRFGPDETEDGTLSRGHSSYLQGKSAPTTPGILSRSSSRRQIHGLSRRSSIYDNGPADLMNYEYSTIVRDNAGAINLDIERGLMPKAKSEAALLAHRQKIAREGAQGRREQRLRHHSRRSTGTGGSMTPPAKTRSKGLEDDWISRTGAAANAIVQESKGQSWLSSRPSSSSFSHRQDTTDEEDDDGYEELAALSTSTSTTILQHADDELTPIHTRSGGWGSRYGSRAGSRRTSRRGSFTNSRAALAPFTTVDKSGASMDEFSAIAIEPDFVDADEESSQDEISGSADGKSFGFGGVVDRLMNFNLFKVEEREETTDDEFGHVSETDAEAAKRMAAENRRKRDEKSKLLERERLGNGQGAASAEDGWSDAAWLLSVASKVIF